MDGLDNHSMLLCCVKCWQILDPALAVRMLNPETSLPHKKFRGFFCLLTQGCCPWLRQSGIELFIIRQGKFAQLHPLRQHFLSVFDANALGRRE
jgi:hypothetical protein